MEGQSATFHICNNHIFKKHCLIVQTNSKIFLLQTFVFYLHFISIHSGFSLWDLQTGPSYSRREAPKCDFRRHGTFIIPGLCHGLQQRQTQG